MRVYIKALGCKLNQSEAESWARGLATTGCQIVDSPEHADLCLINTCTVTHIAARKSRQAVRQCSRSNSQASVVVTGCYAEVSPLEASRLPGVRRVLRMEEKGRLVELVTEKRILWRPALALNTRAERELLSRPAPGARTRAFIKIQDGCDHACTYCIVRIARGRHRSRSRSDILEESIARQSEGYQEIVLTGVHIGAYGREHGDSLANLVGAILASTSFPRLRLSSIEPQDMPDVLPIWADSRLCRHLHLPLQSGCDTVLQRMNRMYTTEQYAGLVHQARSAIADLAVTTDVIVGFPGETEQEFEASAEFVRRMRFARIHVFPFSARAGTQAATMPHQVSPAVKKQRVRVMVEIARAGAQDFRRRFLGSTVNVLWEAAKDDGWTGLTDNYVRVWTQSAQDLHNRILPAHLDRLGDDGLYGAVVEGHARQSGAPN